MINLGNLKIIKSRWRLFLVPLLVIFSTIILFIMVLIPRFKKVIEIREKVKERKLRLEKLSAKLADLDGLDEVSLKNKTDLLLKAVPEKKDIMGILSFLSSLSQTNQVRLDSLDVSPGEISSESADLKTDNLDAMIFKIKITADQDRLFDFLKKIENIVPLFNLSSVKISKSEQYFNGQITLETYSSGLPKSLGKIDAPLPKLSRDEEDISSLVGGLESYERPAEPVISSPLPEGRSTPF